MTSHQEFTLKDCKSGKISVSYNLLNQTREETEPVDKTNIIVAEKKSSDEGKPMSVEKKPDTADEKSSLVIEKKSASTVEKETSVVITQEPVPEDDKKINIKAIDKEKSIISLETKPGSEEVSEKIETTITETKGSLKLNVHKATCLGNKDMIGKSDPYAVIEYGKQKSESKTIKNNLNPGWEHEVILDLDKDNAENITITVYDKDIGKDDVLGNVTFPVKDILNKAMTSHQEFTLKDCKSGKISVSYNLLNQTREETEPVEKTIIIVDEKKSSDERKPMSAEKEPDTADEKSSLVIEKKSATIVEKETSVIITQKLVTEDNEKLDMEAAEMEKPFMSVETTSDLQAVSEKIQTTQTELKGSMKIIIHKATSLVNKDIIGKSDPYAVIEYGKQKSKSKTIKNNLNPVWEHEFILDLDKEEEDNITITVYDDDYGKDDVIGNFELPLKEV